MSFFVAFLECYRYNYEEKKGRKDEKVFNHSRNFAWWKVESFEKGNLLMDVYQLTPEDYVKYINRDVCDVCFIGYPDISVEEKFCEMRK